MQKSNLLKPLSSVSNIFNLKKLINFTGVREIFPFWHIVADKPPKHVKHLYKVRTEKDFIKDIDFLLKYYKPADISEFNIENRNTENKFYLSFDDGLRECYEIIAPILISKGIHASFFVNTDFVDNNDLFYKYKASILYDKFLEKSKNENLKRKIYGILENADFFKINFQNKTMLDDIAAILDIDFSQYLKKEQPYMKLEQIKYLQNKGFTIGAHSAQHPLFSEISIENQISQTECSLNFIANNFSPEYHYFAFPFSDNEVSISFFENIFNYKNLRFTFGTAGIKYDTFENNIQRIAMEKTNMNAEKYLKTMYLAYILKKYSHLSNIVKRK